MDPIKAHEVVEATCSRFQGSEADWRVLRAALDALRPGPVMVEVQAEEVQAAAG